MNKRKRIDSEETEETKHVEKKSKTSSTRTLLVTLSREELVQLCSAFDLLPIPPSAQSLEGEVAKPCFIKQWRQEYPSDEILKEWENMPQNTPKWKDARGGSSGSSEQVMIVMICANLISRFIYLFIL